MIVSNHKKGIQFSDILFYDDVTSIPIKPSMLCTEKMLFDI